MGLVAHEILATTDQFALNSSEKVCGSCGRGGNLGHMGHILAKRSKNCMDFDQNQYWVLWCDNLPNFTIEFHNGEFASYESSSGLEAEKSQNALNCKGFGQVARVTPWSQAFPHKMWPSYNPKGRVGSRSKGTESTNISRERIRYIE